MRVEGSGTAAFVFPGGGSTGPIGWTELSITMTPESPEPVPVVQDPPDPDGFVFEPVLTPDGFVFDPPLPPEEPPPPPECVCELVPGLLPDPEPLQAGKAIMANAASTISQRFIKCCIETPHIYKGKHIG